MAVTSPLNRTDTYGTGAVSVFQFPYYFLQNADLQVWLTDYTTVAAGVPTLLVYGTDYTVAGAGNVLGGSITLLGAPTSSVLPTPPTSTQEISIIRSPALTQELILPGSGPLNTASIVTEFDNLEMQIQALAAKYGDNPFPSTSLAAQIAAMQAKLDAANQPKRLTMKVSEKGALSLYGLGRFPVTLYRGQWERLALAMPDIKVFIEQNADLLAVKA